jgi:hypothetical protein
MSDLSGIWLTIVLGVVFLGYQLAEVLKRIKSMDQRLGEISEPLTSLLAQVRRDEIFERTIRETNDVGATLTPEQMAHEPGIVFRIARQLERVADALDRPAK